MTFTEIDIERCTQCGICIEACPSDAMEMGEESSLVSYPGRCISCGHCAAVCPEDAISASASNARAPFSLEKIPGSLPPEHLLFYQKRSYRRFTTKKLDNNTIKTMIQYAEKAPSSHNFRQREYFVVTDPEKIKEMEEIVVNVYRPIIKILNPVVLKLIRLLSKQAAAQSEEFAHAFRNLVEQRKQGEFPVFRNAPCVVLIAAPKNYDQSRDDCVAAQNYMMLFAQTLGIGSCISGYGQYAHKKLARFLKVPKDKKLFAISFFGYPRITHKKSIRFAEPPVTWITG